MSKFNFQTQEELAGAIRRAQILKPKVEGVYATAQGYVVDRNKGRPELLVSFHNLDALLAGEDISVAEVIEAAEPVEVVSEEVVAPEAVAEEKTEEPAADVSEVKAPAPEQKEETRKERKARQAKEKAE